MIKHESLRQALPIWIVPQFAQSTCANSAGRVSILKKTVEPPIPFRLNLVNGDPSDVKTNVSSGYSWGVQFENPKSGLVLTPPTLSVSKHAVWIKKKTMKIIKYFEIN